MRSKQRRRGLDVQLSPADPAIRMFGTSRQWIRGVASPIVDFKVRGRDPSLSVSLNPPTQDGQKLGRIGHGPARSKQAVAQ
jgi:hypothetical protein